MTELCASYGDRTAVTVDAPEGTAGDCSAADLPHRTHRGARRLDECGVDEPPTAPSAPIDRRAPRRRLRG